MPTGGRNRILDLSERAASEQDRDKLMALLTELIQAIGDAVIDDGPGLLLIVEKQPWGNTLEITRSIETTLQALQPALAGVLVDPTIFRPATYIENALANLNSALLIGCLLVIVVLTLFMFEWRSALISAVAIPLSLITAALVLNYQGDTINTMVLAGLIVALGEVG